MRPKMLLAGVTLLVVVDWPNNIRPIIAPFIAHENLEGGLRQNPYKIPQLDDLKKSPEPLFNGPKTFGKCNDNSLTCRSKSVAFRTSVVPRYMKGRSKTLHDRWHKSPTLEVIVPSIPWVSEIINSLQGRNADMGSLESFKQLIEHNSKLTELLKVFTGEVCSPSTFDGLRELEQLICENIDPSCKDIQAATETKAAAIVLLYHISQTENENIPVNVSKDAKRILKEIYLHNRNSQMFLFDQLYNLVQAIVINHP